MHFHSGKRQMTNKGVTIWLTGLPSAGKTTLAHLLGKRIRERGITSIEILDGDVIRMNLCKDLGYSPEDRMTNIRRIAFVSQLLTRHGVIVIVAAISPYRESRELARREIKNFVEVFVKCPIDVLIERDVKGLYKKALAGNLPHFTGVSDPYEEPLNPEILIETNREAPEASAAKILGLLEKMGYLSDISSTSP
ncbi:MAG TPA: adenylyl-sulfate kinase [Nitrospiria bacterium]|nr:adenylyl-sulfate kinase [Nitrospiria bacterium]